MRIFTMNVFRRISIQAHLVRVDLLDTRILQADALLMHSMAKKESVISFRKQARKLGRCDSSLQNLKTLVTD